MAISNSGHDENNKYSGGVAGDQTGTEWAVVAWYNRPWKCVLRHPDAAVRAEIASLSVAAAKNDNIGYDQSQRGTFETQLKAVGWDPAKITIPCEADCSSGVIALVKAVGHRRGIPALQNVNATYTGNMRSGLKAAGFEVLTESKYLTSDAYLLVGDILLNDGAHTAINVTDGSKVSSPVVTATPTASSTADPREIWDYLLSKIGNPYGVAGLMGNLYAESGLVANNLQNSYEKKLGYNDATYTAAVDNGSYTNFVKDSAGYGLAQWTYYTRKQALLDFVRGKGVSIGSLAGQLEFLIEELSKSYKTVLTTLQKAGSVKEASDAVLTKFERPADQSDSVKSKREAFGLGYFNAYAKQETVTATGKSVSSSGAIKLEGAKSKDKGHEKGTTLHTIGNYRIRAGAGINKTILAVLPKGTEVVWYGYYTTVSGVKWYLVVGGGITGYISSEGLK